MKFPAHAVSIKFPEGMPQAPISWILLKMNKNVFALLLLPLLVAGCSSVITNLTPTTYPRDASGFYRVEAEWKSKRESIRNNSFNPSVVVATQTYLMRPVPLVKDRWEGFVPVPPNEDILYYHFKFDFQVNSFSQPHPDSLLSSDYPLKIVAPK